MTPHTRPPADDDGDHLLVRTIECIEGSVEMELVCEPVFDYGRTAAEWTLQDGRHSADASGAGVTLRLSTDMAIGIEGGRARARHTLQRRRGRLLLAVVGGRPRLAGERRRGAGADGRDHALLARVGERRARSRITRSASRSRARSSRSRA